MERRAGQVDWRRLKKKGRVATYAELFGYGVGVIGLSVDDFLGMDTDEFEAACASFSEHEDMQERERWERMRLLGLMAVQPWSKKKLNAETLLPLPWDKTDKAHEPEHVTMSKEERRKRMEAARSRLGAKY